MRQNLTLSLDKELVRRLRVIAAGRSTSVSAMLREELKRIVDHEEQYEIAKRSALAVLASGLHLGGNPAERDDLHER